MKKIISRILFPCFLGVILSCQVVLAQQKTGNPLDDHFFVEIDDVFSDDDLKSSINAQNQAEGCLEPDQNGEISLPINLKLSIWQISNNPSIQLSTPVDIALTVSNYTGSQTISAYFYDASTPATLHPPGTIVESISNFNLFLDAQGNPVTEVIHGKTYRKYIANVDPYTLRFAATNPNAYSISFTLFNYPLDEEMSLLSHTQTFNVVVGECICANIPLALSMPNPDPVPGELARAQTYIHAAGSGSTIDILPGQDQIYFGGTEIVLKDGFHAHNGSHFHTIIGDCDDYSSVYREALAIKKLSAEIFPNPNQGLFQVRYDLSEKPQLSHFQVRIFDAQGSVIRAFREAVQPQGELKVNLKDYPAGIYWLQLTYGDERIAKAIHKQ